MATPTTGPILAAGAITLGNTWLLNGKDFDPRIPVATAIAVGIASLTYKVAPTFTQGVAWVMLISVFVAPIAGVPPITESVLKWFNGFRGVAP